MTYFKMLPVEPTKEMLARGAKGSGEDSEDVALVAYEAMVAAAPPAPASIEMSKEAYEAILSLPVRDDGRPHLLIRNCMVVFDATEEVVRATEPTP